MSTRWIRLVLAIYAVPFISAPALAQQAPAKPHAGMLRYPDVSATQIVFLYANDLWIAPREGGVASPLASPPGQEMMPRFSPDGKTIAFMGNYDGNRDLYTIGAEGGIPQRITYHPASEFLCDWTPQGSLLFSSNGRAINPRTSELYTVSSKGGFPARIPVPYGTNAAASPDGRWIAYTPHSTDFRTWKCYRGGMATDIWLFDLRDKKSKRITDFEGTDSLPMWHGPRVYYLSDDGASHRENIWMYDTATGRRTQVTRFDDFDVKFPAIGPGPSGKGEIVFQLGSTLQLLDLSTNRSKAVEIRIPGARAALRPQNIDASKYIDAWSVSPTGKRAAIEARGDIWSSPAKEGSPRNLTRTSGVAERDPSWSPDGRYIAYFSDATGEYELYLHPADGSEPPKKLTSGGSAFRYDPIWSPDSKRIVFSDKTGAFFLADAATGQFKQIDRDPHTFGIRVNWSHDGRWLTYSKGDEKSRMGSIWIYNTESGEKRQVTRGMFDDGNPTFDRTGDWLYYSSTRAFQPTYADRDTTWIYNNTQVLLAVPLRADIKSPFNAESDEEPIKEADSALKSVSLSFDAQQSILSSQDDEVSGVWNGTASGANLPGGSITVKLTLRRSGNSVTGDLETPIGGGGVSGSYNAASKDLTLSASIEGGPTVNFNLRVSGDTITGTATAEGQTVQIRLQRSGAAPQKPGEPAKPGDKPADSAKPRERVTIDFDGFEQRAVQLPVRRGRFGQIGVNARGQLLFVRLPTPGSEESAAVKLFDLKDDKREEKNVGAGTNFEVTADGNKILIPRGQAAVIQDASAGSTAQNVVTSPMTAIVEPEQEWRQMFNDAWRIERDFFYDPTMHGVDWKAIREQYARMLPDVSNREDLAYVISEMISELNVGHAYYSGGDAESQPAVSVGLLGADLEIAPSAGNSRQYRIGNIYQGGPWDSDARGPLSQPGIDVKEGDFLLAVNGISLTADRDPWAAFQGLAGQAVTLTIRRPQESATRSIIVRLLSGDTNLRYREWVEKNRAHVEKASDGRIGYIHVPSTGIDGQSELYRQLLGQRGKDALIIDERWNSGGQIPTRFIELINRPITNYWARRDHADWAWPWDTHHGPKAMLINGLAGSGGDAFPWYFRQAGLGKLIGTRTWGGLVGISGNPNLIDGARVTAPTFAFYEKDGSWGVEGHGVDPDIEVLDDPAMMQNGADPQLDAAIRHLQEELKRNPYTPAKRPTYPNRKGFGLDPRDR